MAGFLAAVTLDSQSPRTATAMERGTTAKPDSRSAPDLDTPAVRAWGDDDDRCLRLWISLARSYSTFARAVACKVTEYDLTVPQFGIMEALHHLGPLTLGELADKLLVTGGSDYHGLDIVNEVMIGGVEVPLSVAERLLALVESGVLR